MGNLSSEMVNHELVLEDFTESPPINESFERRNLPKQEQSITRIRYFGKNKDTGGEHEEIRPLTGSQWNLAPVDTTNPYRTFDNQPVYKVIAQSLVLITFID